LNELSRHLMLFNYITIYVILVVGISTFIITYYKLS